MKDASVSAPVLKIDSCKPQTKLIRVAAKAALAGGALIIPTDTVYGLCLATAAAPSPQKLYALKKRNVDKAIPWLVADKDALIRYGSGVSAYCQQLAKHFWPGALTLIVKAANAVPATYQGNDGTIALRMPDNKIVYELIKLIGSPLATTSANLQGGAEATTVRDLDMSLVYKVSLIIDGGTTLGSVASTIVDCTGTQPLVIRQGVLGTEELLAVL